MAIETTLASFLDHRALILREIDEAATRDDFRGRVNRVAAPSFRSGAYTEYCGGTSGSSIFVRR